MGNIQNKILNFFDNRQLLKNIRTSSVLLLLLAIPLLWFGFKDTFDFKSLFSWNFASIIVVITISILIATIETKLRAFDDRFLLDTELQELQKDIEQNSITINKKDKRMKVSRLWIDGYNTDQQEMYNEILTHKTITDLEKRSRRFRIKGKERRANSIDKRIDELNNDKLFDKKFVPYDLNKLVNIDNVNTKKKKKKGNNEITENPKSVNVILALIGIPIRATGVGVIGTIPFLLKESAGTIVLFYLSYLLTMTFTIITQYLLTTYKMDNGYKNALRKIKTLQEILIEHLDNQDSPIEELIDDGEIVIKDEFVFPKEDIFV